MLKASVLMLEKSAPRFVLVMDPVQPRNNYAQLVVVAKDIDARKRLEPQIRELVAANLPNVVSYSRSIRWVRRQLIL